MVARKPPHGTELYNAHHACRCKKCGPKRDAIRRLVDSFSHVPARWIETLAEQPGFDGPMALPMWGTLFVPKNSADVSNIEALLREIQEGNEEDESLASSGWKEVADTGIYAVTFDGELLLGIHGAGYCFFDDHWTRLYDALGYRWHERW